MTGCFPFKNVTLEQPVTETALNESVSQQIAENGLFICGDFENRCWWTLFDDNSLSECIETALASNPSLQAVHQKVISSEQEALAVRSRYLPLVTTDGSYKYWHFSKDGLFRGTSPLFPAVITLFGLNLNFDYEIDIWGRYHAEYYAALGQAAAECAMDFQAQLELSIAVGRTYFDLKVALAIEKELSDLQRLYALEDDLSFLRYDNRIDDERAPLASSRDLAAIEVRQASNRATIAVARAVLKSLLGMAQDCDLPPVTAEICYDEKPLPIPENIGLSLLGMRPDLAAQIWRVRAAAHQVKVAQTAFYPNIALQSSGGLESIFNNKIFSFDSLTGFLLPAFTFPIYTGGRLPAQLNKSISEYKANIDRYQQMILDAASHVIGALASLKEVNIELGKSCSEVKLQRKITALTDIRYQQGIDNYLSAIMAEKAYHEQRINWLNIIGFDLYARLVLIKELGGGYKMGGES